CAAKDATRRFLGRAATPPRRGGESSPSHHLSNTPARVWTAVEERIAGLRNLSSEVDLRGQLNNPRIIGRREGAETAGWKTCAALHTDIVNSEIAQSQHAVGIAVHLFKVDAVEEIERIENDVD